MSTNSLDNGPRDGEHPSDELPDFLHGALSSDREREVSRHLEECSVCAEELDVLSLLAEQAAPSMTPEERSRIYAQVGFGGRTSGGAGGGSDWRRAAWKMAAAIALLITGVGVWQVYLAGSSDSVWSASAALEAWEQDVSELAPSSEDAEALLAMIEPASTPLPDPGFGASDLDRVVDGVLDGLDAGVLDAGAIDGISVPWEE